LLPKQRIDSNAAQREEFHRSIRRSRFLARVPSAPSFESHSIAVLQKDALFSRSNNKGMRACSSNKLLSCELSGPEIAPIPMKSPLSLTCTGRRDRDAQSGPAVTGWQRIVREH